MKRLGNLFFFDKIHFGVRENFKQGRENISQKSSYLLFEQLDNFQPENSLNKPVNRKRGQLSENAILLVERKGKYFFFD